MTLSEIHRDAPGAASRTAATAEDARKLGFEHVETHYEPQTGMHTVTADPPTQARRTLDGLLGR